MISYDKRWSTTVNLPRYLMIYYALWWYRVRVGQTTSEPFKTKMRVAQGECLSPILFTLYLAKGVNPLTWIRPIGRDSSVGLTLWTFIRSDGFASVDSPFKALDKCPQGGDHQYARPSTEDRNSPKPRNSNQTQVCRWYWMGCCKLHRVHGS